MYLKNYMRRLHKRSLFFIRLRKRIFYLLLTLYRPLAIQQHTHVRPASQALALFRFRLGNTIVFVHRER